MSSAGCQLHSTLWPTFTGWIDIKNGQPVDYSISVNPTVEGVGSMLFTYANQSVSVSGDPIDPPSHAEGNTFFFYTTPR